MFTTCTLYLQGILGSSEDTLALRRILEDLCVQRGGLEDMPPAPGAAFQHRYHFAGMENHGAMPADLSDFLIAKDLSFVWIAAAQAGTTAR